MATDAASWAEIVSLLSLSSALSFYLGSQLTASKTLPPIHINTSPSAPHPSPPVSVSPRSAGALGRTSAGQSAGTPEKGENPWVVSEGDRKYELGDVKRIALTIDELLLLAVPHLNDTLPEFNAKVSNLRQSATLVSPKGRCGSLGLEPMGFINFTSDDSIVVGDIVRNAKQKTLSRAYLRAGPRATLYFRPNEVRAAIVTCGGLCPGLNNVIRDIVNTLSNGYGVHTIYGVKHGYWGFWTPEVVPLDAPNRPPQCPLDAPVMLTPEKVASIHTYGGTMLGSDRGGDNPEVTMKFLRHYGINQLYIIGGDGTHRGAQAIYKRCVEERLPVVVAGLPKTIDNDVDIIDRSFGFDTAFAEAQHAIRTAKIEAQGAPNGIGLVKLMGRYAGFIASQATLASGEVDLCLIPEVPIVLEGQTSILGHLERVIARQGHAVVVVAEGAGEELLAADKLARGEKIEVDAGGNRKLPPIAPWLKSKINAYFTAKGDPVSLKYIDPSYMIRSVAANPADAVYCTMLAQSAVHGAMAGFTGFSVGLTNNRLVYLPITAITANSPRRMNPRGRTYERVLSITGQPDPLSDPEVASKWAATAAPKSDA